MGRRTSQWTLYLLAGLAAIFASTSMLHAQTYVPTAQELDQLLAPVALYPDALLAQITSASTNPQEILDVDDWLHQNPAPQGQALSDAAQAQGFDPAFVALVNFPQVLDMMAQNIDDYAAIGAAYEANPDSVTDSVQNLREVAYSSGALRSGPQQRVVLDDYNGQQIIQIVPVNQDVVYVPVYNPDIIYGRVGLAPSFITFGAGIGLGWGIGHPWGWGGWGWNWRTRILLYNRSVWRPQYNRYRPRRPFGARPPNYHNRPVIRPVPRGPSRPRPTRAPRPNRPGAPAVRPVRPNRPTVQPVRPTHSRPQPRPSNGARPAPNPRPTPPASGARPGPQRPQKRPKPMRRIEPQRQAQPQHKPEPQHESEPQHKPEPQRQVRPQRQAQPQRKAQPKPAPR